MPLLKKKTAVAFDIQAADGTPATITEADIVFVAEDVVYSPEFTNIPRNVLGPSLAHKVNRVATKLARITFRLQVRGSGDAGDVVPEWGSLLNACGFSTTASVGVDHTFDPVVPIAPATAYGEETGNSSATIWVYQDGKAKKATDCRGTFRIVGEAGNLAYWEFDFLGVYADPADVAYPVLTGAGLSATPVPPVVASAAFSFHSVPEADIVARNFTLDIGNQVVPRFDVSAASGFKGMLINDRLTTCVIDPEEPLVADWDLPTANEDGLMKFANARVGAFSLAIGSATDNTVTITAPSAQVQVTDYSEGDREELQISNITLSFFAPEEEVAETPDIRIVAS